MPEELLDTHIAAYRQKLSAQLSVHSRCANPMLTGRSGFDYYRQELSASHELKPIAQETQKYVGFVAPNLWIKEGGMEPFDIISGPLSTATSRTNGSWTTDWKMNSFTRTS